MDEVLEFLKANPAYFLATVDADGNPQVRPFGTCAKVGDALYIQTGKIKDVYKQMKAHPEIALCGWDGKGTWLRIEATAVEDDSVETNSAVLAEYPSLQARYTPGDGNCTVFALTHATASFCSFTADPRIVKF